MLSAVEVVGSHEQLQAELAGDFHIRNASLLAILLVVVEIFDDLLENDAGEVFQEADTGDGFTEVACGLYQWHSSEDVVTFERTVRIQQSTDGA